jgi:type I restriction enzyme S subunit
MTTKLPDSWESAPLGDVCKTLKGKKPKNSGKPSNDRTVPYINIKAFETGIPVEFAEPGDYPECSRENVLIVWDGARSGLTGRGVSGYIGSTLSKIWSEIIDNGYLYYFLCSQYNYINTNTKGVGIPHVDPTVLFSIDVPIAPLNEQKRIVAEIEKQFSRLDEAVDNLKRVKANLKRYKASVLKAAVEGKLTEEWREKHPDVDIISVINDLDEIPYTISNSWKWTSIKQIGKVKGGKRLPKGKKLIDVNTDYPYIRAGNLKNGTVSTNDLMFVTEEIQSKIKKYIVDAGDVYITIVGACIGDAGIIPDELDGANLTENAAKICNLSKIINKYLSFWLRSTRAQYEIKGKVFSATLGKLSLTRIKALPVPIPPIEEQKVIVSYIESLLSVAERVEIQVENELRRADRLRQSILKKAFTGKL